MNRREFLKKTFCGSGALIATSALPTWAAEKGPAAANATREEIFRKRGRYEQLALSYATVEIGLEKPFSILHITDTHLTEAYPSECEGTRQAAYQRVRTFGGFQEIALQDSLEYAKANCDYVLHTGDLMDWRSEANFDLARKYLGEGVFGSMGNHEFYTYLPGERATSEESFKEASWPILKAKHVWDARFSAQVVNGVNFICLDDTFGRVPADLVARFKDEAKRGLPMVLCMHVPFVSPAFHRVDARYWGQGKFKTSAIPPVSGDYKRQQEDAVTRDFIAYLKGLPQLKAILTGHAHLFYEERFSPTAVQYVTAGNFLFAAREVLFI